MRDLESALRFAQMFLIVLAAKERDRFMAWMPQNGEQMMALKCVVNDALAGRTRASSPESGATREKAPKEDDSGEAPAQPTSANPGSTPGAPTTYPALGALRYHTHEHSCACGATWICNGPCRLTLHVGECERCAT